MAQKTLRVDDLDGAISDGVETQTFAVSGVNYEVDLGPQNQTLFNKALVDFISAARVVGNGVKPAKTAAAKTPAKAKSKTAPKADAAPTDSAKIREWARKNGFSVGDRGRIRPEITEAYKNAHST